MMQNGTGWIWMRWNIVTDLRLVLPLASLATKPSSLMSLQKRAVSGWLVWGFLALSWLPVRLGSPFLWKTAHGWSRCHRKFATIFVLSCSLRVLCILLLLWTLRRFQLSIKGKQLVLASETSATSCCGFIRGNERKVIIKVAHRGSLPG